MAINKTLYLAPQDLAERTGWISSRFRVAGNLFILDYNDVKMISLRPDETKEIIMSRLQVVDEGEAFKLIQEGGRKMGVDNSFKSQGSGSKYQVVSGVREIPSYKILEGTEGSGFRIQDSSVEDASKENIEAQEGMVEEKKEEEPVVEVKKTTQKKTKK